jgi:hypothetical protein
MVGSDNDGPSLLIASSRQSRGHMPGVHPH